MCLPCDDALIRAIKNASCIVALYIVRVSVSAVYRNAIKLAPLPNVIDICRCQQKDKKCNQYLKEFKLFFQHFKNFTRQCVFIFHICHALSL